MGFAESAWLREVLEAGAAGRPALCDVLNDPQTHRLQVLVSLPSENKLRHEAFRVGAEYVYPASCVKLAAAVGALRFLRERAEAWGIPLEPTTPIVFHAASGACLPRGTETQDASNKRTQAITVAHELRKMFLVSDNRSFNRLVDLQRLEYLNAFLWGLGLTPARLRHRLYDCVPTGGPLESVSPAVEWRTPCGGVCLPERPEGSSHLKKMDPGDEAGGSSKTQVGQAYIDASGHQVDCPLDFSSKNHMTLNDLNSLLVALCRPDLAKDMAGLGLTEGDRQWLLEIMAEYPGDSLNPEYSRDDFPDDYGKFFLNGVTRVWDKAAVRIHNKVGQAYGFSTDTA